MHRRLTSSLANLSNGLLDWHALRPPHNLLALKLVRLLLEAAEAVAEREVEAGGEAEEGAGAHHGGESLD